jgi:hypothetical protein
MDHMVPCDKLEIVNLVPHLIRERISKKTGIILNEFPAAVRIVD